MKRAFGFSFLWALACTESVSPSPPPALPAALADVCEEVVGEPRVLQVRENIFVAIGYDLANTILIRTSAGHVIVDAMSSPSRAKAAKAALLAKAPGPIRYLIFTHSHLDHVGGCLLYTSPSPRD